MNINVLFLLFDTGAQSAARVGAGSLFLSVLVVHKVLRRHSLPGPQYVQNREAVNA